MTNLSLRLATSGDSKMLWEWTNDPVVRESSFSPDLIPWENHRLWFDNKLADASYHIFVAEEDQSPAGLVRFDCEDTNSEISVNLAPDFRGRGLGTELITSGVQKLFEESDVKEVHAYIKTDNPASSKTFERAGFKSIGTETMKNTEVYHYVLKRP